MQCVCWRNDRNSPTDLTNCCRDPFKNALQGLTTSNHAACVASQLGGMREEKRHPEHHGFLDTASQQSDRVYEMIDSHLRT